LRLKTAEPVSVDEVFMSLPHPNKVMMKMIRYKRLCFE